MFDDLSQVKRRYEELAYRMTTPEAMNDPAAYAAMMREYKELTPLVEAYCSYTALQKEVDEEKALLDAPTEDAAFNDMVQQELRENWQKLEGLEQKIRLLLLPKDANDEKSIIMEIRAGAGGEEAALFAHSLHRMYTMYAARQNWACSVISLNETELGGVKEITFSIEGPGVYSRLKFESGVHRVQRVPETETQGRIHTSTATVAVMPEAEEVELELNPKDLLRRRRPAHQQNVVRHPGDPPAHRYGGGVPGPAQPARKQRAGIESSAQPPAAAKAGSIRPGI